MVAAFTSDDLILLGYEKIQPISVGAAAIAFSGKAKAGIVETEHAFVYIKADATREDLIKVAQLLQRKEIRPYVLKSKSGATDAMLRSVFGRDVTIYQIEELLWERVRELFKSYAESISKGIPSEPNFIAPRGEDLLPKDRLDNFLIEYFTRNIHSQDKKRLVVLKADAGVGKTTFCRQLVKEFAKKINTFKVVPVYVEAAHWGGRVTTTTGLWDIIQLSLQNFDAGSGISRSLFEAALRRGLILFVFDGFDELCSSSRSNISTSDAMESLQGWVEDSEARIVLTTRTPYWAQEVGSDPSYVHSLSLLPFNPQQAKEYIRKCFEGDDSNFQAARDLYADVIAHANAPDNLGGAREQFWSLPIAVSMICDAVKAGVSRNEWREFSLESLLVAICERETKRQNLSSDGFKQFRAFQELALLDAREGVASFERDDLLSAGISESDASKFASHPLVRINQDGRCSFTYDFFAPFLRALAIRDAVVEKSENIRQSVVDAMRAEENGNGFQMEHATRLLERHNIEDVYGFLRNIPLTELGARSFVVHLLQRLADFQVDVKSSLDRAGVVLRGLADADGSKTIRNARFTGSFRNLDLSGLEFVGCEFLDATFNNVKFSKCIFRSCVFEGEVQFVTKADEKSFSEATLVGDCEIKAGTRIYLESLLKTDSLQRSELIKDILEGGLAKFWHNGKFKAGIRKADWKKGALGRSRSSDALLEIFKREGLIAEGAISGVAEGGWIFSRSAIGDLQNFMDHRHLSGAVLAAFRDLEGAFS